MARTKSIISKFKPSPHHKNHYIKVPIFTTSSASTSWQLSNYTEDQLELQEAWKKFSIKNSPNRNWEKNKFFGISCHDEEDIKKAESLEADYIFLSPVNKTSSHQNQNPLGWKKFSELAQETKLPVFALGGLGKEDLSEAEKNGAYGIAGISKFWSY